MASRIFAKLACVALVLATSCNDNPTAAEPPHKVQPVRLALAAGVFAAPGAIIDAELSYVPLAGGARVVLARDSTTIDTGGPDASFSVTGDVSPCVADAAAAEGQCTIAIAITLKRDGRILDTTEQQFVVSASTTNVAVPSVQLFEVATVTIDPTGTATLEPGDTRTLTAVARDRSSIVVPGRNAVWSVVSGGIAVTATGALTVSTAGAARVRATVGGRTGELALQILPTSVASIDIAPLDTALSVGGTVTYRAIARDAAGQVLAGRAVTFSSSASSIASVVANVASGIAAGTTTITASSVQGRNGTVVTSATTLRVLATAPILVDRNAVTFDVVPGVPSASTDVFVSTDAGRTIRGLVAGVTYSPNVTPWLTATLLGTTTQTTLTLRASPGALDTGVFSADVRLTSTLDPHVPVTVRVTMRVVRVQIPIGVLSVGPFPAGPPAGPFSVTVETSSPGVPLTGLSASVEYITTPSGWLSAVLQNSTAAPSTSMVLTVNTVGLPAGAHQARVIVTSAAPLVSFDTLNFQVTIGQSGSFSGLVQHASTRQPVAGALVEVRRPDNTLATSAITAANGTWTSGLAVAGTYNLTFSATGFQVSQLFGQVLVGGATQPITPLANVDLIPLGSGTGRILGEVRDATTNFVLSAATVELRAGANNTTGTVLATTTTSSNGAYAFASRTSGAYTVAASRTNFTPGSVSVTVVSTDVTAPVTFLSPIGAPIAWRFVLSWGATPLDLDAHLTGPLINQTGRFHVYFGTHGTATQSPFVFLDQDAQSGFGPETITLHQQIPGVYRFFVDNFSGTPAISTSTARVDVYQGNTLVRQFFPPQQSGVVWTVFEINGSVLTPINVINSVFPATRVPDASSSSPSKATNAIEEFMSFSPWLWVKRPATIRR